MYGIGVEPDLLPREGCGDDRQGLGGAAEILPPNRLVVRDHDRHAGGAADRKTLFEAVEHPVALVAHMRRVERARRPQQSGQRLDLGRRRVLGRGVSEAARHAHRAGVERFLQQFAHTPDLGRFGRPVECAHRPTRKVE